MTKTFLLQDYSSEKVEHLLVLNTNATTQDIQNYIDLLNDQWFIWEENDDGTLGDDCDYYNYASQGEYVIDHVNDMFNGVTVDYENILYF